MSEVIIIGNGKLAQSLFSNFKNYSAITLKKYKSDIHSNSSSIFVHLGSGRQYKESINMALNSGASYIQAATEKEFKMLPPSGNNIKFIEAPNLDLKIIKLFHWIKGIASFFKDEPMSIIESHQKEKKSKPGTALKFCEYLNIPKS